ncbi:MAG: hypothetical protein WD077_08040 [Bacteroidia bacterium]
MRLLRVSLLLNKVSRNAVFFGIVWLLMALFILANAYSIKGSPEFTEHFNYERSINASLKFTFYGVLLGMWVAYDLASLFRNGMIKQILVLGYSRLQLHLMLLVNAAIKVLALLLCLTGTVLIINLILFSNSFDFWYIFNFNLLFQFFVFSLYGSIALFFISLFKSYLGLVFIIIYNFLEHFLIGFCLNILEVDLRNYLPLSLTQNILNETSNGYEDFFIFALYLIAFPMASFLLIKKSKFY